MAAAMAATTMVTKNNRASLAMDKKNWLLRPVPEIAFPWSSKPETRSLDFPRMALFASVGLSLSHGAQPVAREHDGKARPADDVAHQLAAAGEAGVQKAQKAKKAKKQQLGLRKVRVKIGNPHLRRLVSGAIAGAVSRTFVAPLETIRTHLMVGSSGADSMAGVFRWIMGTEGWPGLFRGNAVNVLRVAPSKAIEASQPPHVFFVQISYCDATCSVPDSTWRGAALHLRHGEEVPNPGGRPASQGPHPHAARRRSARRSGLNPVHLSHGARQDPSHHRGENTEFQHVQYCISTSSGSAI
uniref:Uncharacterized protein n=1 Tax=Aegilops tauschii subsp. strangulata TaxID=200361 RepID=A0A453NQZ1_AEGTS